MPLSRRSLFSTAAAASLLAVAEPLRARAAAPRASAASDHAALRANTLALLAGTAASNARPEAAAKLDAVESTARKRLAAMDGAGQGELFAGLPLGSSDSHLETTFQYLYEIALATRVPGRPSDLHDDAAVQHRVVDALVRLHDDYYGDQSTGYYGNWFTWEIGISTHVSRLLVLLRDVIAAYRPGLPATYVASMDAYLRHGKDGDVDLDSRFHTGANLADITTDRILQGAALSDDARIRKAVADQLTVYATIDPYDLRHGVTDGFYADGSFLQHASVAYTGSYGKGLLTRAVQTVRILDGTDYVDGGTLTGVVRGWVADSFAPLIFEGWMMECVKGRSVSRTTGGYADVAAVAEAVTDLSAHLADGSEATALRGYVRYLHETSKAPPDPARFVSPVTVVRYADVLASSVPARDLQAAERSVAFNAMDRTVHRRPGHAFALARSSQRISLYEYMSGENLTPWFQGAGAHHLYLTGRDQSRAHGVDYYTTVPPHRLAGVTAPVEHRRTVPELYGTLWYDNPEAGFTASSEAQNTYVYFPCATNTFSGGAVLGPYGAAGMVLADDVAYAAQQAGELPGDFVAYRNARGTKSWFLLDDEIVVLGAGVGDPAGRAVTTTADSRIADPSETVTLTGALRDGTPWSASGSGSGPGPSAPLAWLRWAAGGGDASVGYVFLDGPDPTVTLETVTRSRRAVRLANPDTPVTKQVFSVVYEQPPGAPPAAMAYALVPHASPHALGSYAHGPLSVLANTRRVQAVAHTGLGLVAANVFTAGTAHAGRLAVDGPASVLLWEGADGTVSLAVSDPTTQRRGCSLTVHGRRLRVVSADEGVRVRNVHGGTRIEVDTRHAYGRSFTATLR